MHDMGVKTLAVEFRVWGLLFLGCFLVCFFFTVILQCYFRVAYKFMEMFFLLDRFKGLPGNTSVEI